MTDDYSDLGATRLPASRIEVGDYVRPTAGHRDTRSWLRVDRVTRGDIPRHVLIEFSNGTVWLNVADDDEIVVIASPDV